MRFWRRGVHVIGVHRGGDFQTVYFSNGSHVYGGTDQDPRTGEYVDNRGIDEILRKYRWRERS